MAEIDECIARGVALLDARRPGWYRDVDIDILDMCAPDVCILGQLYGSYSDGKWLLGLEFRSGGRYGFDVYEDDDGDWSFEDLDNRWAIIIRARLEADCD